MNLGGLIVLCIDSNISRMKPASVMAQDQWVDEWLRDAAADPDVWMVLPILHHPPFTNVSPRYFVFGSGEVKHRFVPRFLACQKVAAVIAGHVHTYERIQKDGVQFIVTGGGGSPRFKLRPKERRKHVDLAPDSGLIRPFHYLRCIPDEGGRRLAVETVCLSPGGAWTVGDRFDLTDRRPTDRPRPQRSLRSRRGPLGRLQPAS